MDRPTDFHDPDRVGTLFYPDLAAVAAAAERAGLPPASGDRPKVCLLLVDLQIDFCHPGGALFVPGAVADIRRVVAFLLGNAARISQIVCSLDTHAAFQIFHPSWWEDEDGRHPDPFTTITAEDVAAARWRPLRMPEWSTAYVRRLEAGARKQLTIWPYHVGRGGLGNALDPELWSAVFWHALARGSDPVWWVKGTIPQTEHYSILRPEVPVPAAPEAAGTGELWRLLEEHDRVVIAGEAASHCVLETLEDLVERFGAGRRALGKLVVLHDCTSPVRHPEIDFAAVVRERFAELGRRGVRFAASTDRLVL